MAGRDVERAKAVAQAAAMPLAQVEATLRLLAAECTVPFIARYRGHDTGGLDAAGVRGVLEAAAAYEKLEKRRRKLREQLLSAGVNSAGILAAVAEAASTGELDEIYAPYKPSAPRSKAGQARAAGLEPAAERVASGGRWVPNEWCRKTTLSTAEAAATGVGHLLAEAVANSRDSQLELRKAFERQGVFKAVAKRRKDKKVTVTGKSDSKRRTKSTRQIQSLTLAQQRYGDFTAALRSVQPHQILAIQRGEANGELTAAVVLPPEHITRSVNRLAKDWALKVHPSARQAMATAVADGTTRLLVPRQARAFRKELSEKAHAAGVRAFAENVRSLLLTPPVRGQVVAGIDPGFSHGCKVAVVDSRGEPLETATLYPHAPQSQSKMAAADLAAMLLRTRCRLVAIGNGTACRETEAWIASVLALPGCNSIEYTVVSEAGASVYSVSDLAEAELPGYAPMERGAISIARRVLDPLNELCKIEPHAIGVGMYQHDMVETALRNALDIAVGDAVAEVGADLNTAGEHILKRIPGLDARTAREIVAHRTRHGSFDQRESLLAIRGIGARRFEQAVGFVRVHRGDNPYDATAIHPESYRVADNLLHQIGAQRKDTGTATIVARLREHALCDIEGNVAPFDSVAIAGCAQELKTNEITLRQIIGQLAQRPDAADPRNRFTGRVFRREVLSMDDVKVGTRLDGRVSSVVDFGAFVDVGLKRDGLVHTSQMERPLMSGEKVSVIVVKIERASGRLGLSTKNQSKRVAADTSSVHRKRHRSHTSVGST